MTKRLFRKPSLQISSLCLRTSLWLLLPYVAVVSPFSISTMANRRMPRRSCQLIDAMLRNRQRRMHRLAMFHPTLTPHSAKLFASHHRAAFPRSLQSITKSGTFASLHSFVHRESTSLLKSTESPSSGTYYQSAVSLAQQSFSTESTTNSPGQFFPKWWPRDATSVQNYIAFSDHIAHVIVPNVTSSSLSNDDSAVAQLNCEDVIQWVLNAAKNRNNDAEVELLFQQQNKTSVIGSRRYRIEQEWKEGESVSTPTCVLDPAYRHNPSFLPQPQHNNQELNNIPDLIPMELLALGSVWHLPTSATSTIDRFDPSNGIKPFRRTVGDWNKTVHSGDYFRIHFDPRRFGETNRWNWGCAIGDDIADDEKPGVIVARDDDAGYLIIDKPPNVPVHARVDNLLENVASSVGRMLWMERKESFWAGCSRAPSDVSTTMNSSKEQTYYLSQTAASKRKQKTEQLVYVATPQRLDQNTSGLLVVATKKSFAAYFAKLLRMKVSHG